MARKTSKQTLARPSIARQIVKNIEKIQQRKIIDLEEWHRARHRAENLEATVASDEKLSRLDPLHALYVYAQDMMDILAQQLVHLPECRKLAAAFAEAVEVYRPSYPPESTVTLSYFSCWALFDLEVGLARETIADVVIAVSAKLGINANMLGLYRTMRASRMGLYEHQGNKGGRIQLKELVTEREISCVSPSGYLGRPGELWFARIFPDPSADGRYGYSVVFTTPYVIARSEGGRVVNTASLEQWRAFLARTLEKTGETDRIRAYEKLMKYGLNRRYWPEYIFTGYANYSANAVLLTGIPDLPETLPHAG